MRKSLNHENEYYYSVDFRFKAPVLFRAGPYFTALTLDPKPRKTSTQAESINPKS